jgi:hypothetical protein
VCLSLRGQRPSHGKFFREVPHLNAVDERRTTSDSNHHVKRLGHFFKVRSFFETGSSVRVDAVRALHRVRYSESDQGLFTLGECSFLKYCSVIFKEFPSKFRSILSDFLEFPQVTRIIISFQARTSCGHRVFCHERADG